MSDHIKIRLDDKPNLRKLAETDKEHFRMVLTTMLQIAEDAANSDRVLPWYEVPQKIHPGLNFEKVAPAVMEAFFDIEGLSPENFSVLGVDLHPLSLLQKQEFKNNVGYSKWRKHFGMEPTDNINAGLVKSILRKLLYYAKYIDVASFGKALMSKQLEVHKALPLPNAERLPFYPALRYQQEHFGDLEVGKFWSEIGALYGGKEPHVEHDTCPACHVGQLWALDTKPYSVCDHCNIGFSTGID